MQSVASQKSELLLNIGKYDSTIGSDIDNTDEDYSIVGLQRLSTLNSIVNNPLLFNTSLGTNVVDYISYSFDQIIASKEAILHANLSIKATNALGMFSL